MGRRRLDNKKQPISVSFTSDIINRIDKYVKGESRSLFLEIAANNELDRRMKAKI